jgi:hypothetical protein
MDMVTVTSSNLSAVSYDPVTLTLEVAFRHGGVYKYFDVPAAIYESLMKASSIGSFFAANIKNSYRFEKL